MPEILSVQTAVSPADEAELPALGTSDLYHALDIPLIREAIRPDHEQWTPRELRALTELVSSRAAGTLSDIVEIHEEQRWWLRLGLTAGVELWLLSWAPGQGTEPHDHGGASGSFSVLFGELHEDYCYPPGPVRRADYGPGRSIGFDGGRSHQVRNLGGGNAASVHAYSPPLLPVRHFADLAEAPPLSHIASVTTASRTTAKRSAPIQPEAGPAGVDHLLAGCRAELDRVSPHTAARMQEQGTMIIDIRPQSDRLAEGEIPGALTVERIVLEWRLDPSSAHRLDGLRPEQPVVLVCNEGYASSLAATQARGLGLTHATDLDGGFRAWKAAGLPVVFSR